MVITNDIDIEKIWHFIIANVNIFTRFLHFNSVTSLMQTYFLPLNLFYRSQNQTWFQINIFENQFSQLLDFGKG